MNVGQRFVCILAVEALSTALAAETNYEWVFQDIDRSMRVTEPVVENGLSDAAFDAPYWTINEDYGVRTQGLMIVVK